MHVWPAEGVGMTPPAYHSHNKDEWLTPPAIVHAARLVMGPIDLDPCLSLIHISEPTRPY